MKREKFDGIDFKWANYELFISSVTILALFNIAVILFAQGDDTKQVALSINMLLAVIFLIDFALRLRRVSDRKRYFFREYGWLDLIAGFPFFLAPLARTLRLVRTIASIRREGSRELMQSIRAKRADTALLFVGLAVIYLLEFGSIFILRAEVGAPNAEITTADDAFWWVLVTISTVGYGDLVPVTNQGRLVSTFVIVAGIGVFGTLSGYLANSFLGQSESRTRDRITEMTEPVVNELTRLNQAQEEARQAQEEENQKLLARLEALEKLLQEKRQ